MFPTDQAAFQPLINSSSPGFNAVAVDNTAVAFALESTALNRIWQGPASRSVRLTGLIGDRFYANFGASAVTAASTNSVLCIGSVPVIFSVDPKQTYVALVSSTTITINIALGVGK